MGRVPLVLAMLFGDPGSSVTEPGPGSALVTAAFRQDPPDSLYRKGRAALLQRDFTEAARLLERVADDYPEARIAPDALYWAAFAHYRVGGDLHLRAALRLLDRQRTQYRGGSARADAEALTAVVVSALAKGGDQEAIRTLSRGADVDAACRSGNADVPTLYLDALTDVDPERGFVLLRQLLERPACPPELRRNGLFILAKLRRADLLPLLLSVARTDPDPNIRRSAVYWIGRVSGPAAITALDSVARIAGDTLLQQAALAALADVPAPEGRRALRDLAASDGVSGNVRRTAIMLLMERGGAEDISTVRELLPKLRNPAERQGAYAALSRANAPEGVRALLSAAMDTLLPTTERRVALVLAAEKGAPTVDLVRIYDTASEYMMREAALAMMAQRRDSMALGKLQRVASNERDERLRIAAIALLAEVRGRPLPQDARIRPRP